MIQDDENFRLFATNLERTIERYGQDTGEDHDRGLLVRQSGQFQKLVGLEREFRETLIRCRWGAQTYRAFMALICEENGNILTSRPYFRERQDVCIGPISKALKNRHVPSLYQYHFNYNFIAFVLQARAWPANGRIRKLARQISALRLEIVEQNLPLAISQSRIFWQKAPMKMQDTRFTFMDFVQIAADGMLSAVDKFVLPEGVEDHPERIRVWRAVAIGRMKGNFIEMFSETSIHFFPQDKRKLYRANKHLKDFGGQVDFEKLATCVNSDLQDDGLVTTASELAALMGAAANAGNGSDTASDEENIESPLDRAAAAPDWQPDVRYERAETYYVMKQAILDLPLMEQKLIRMRGVAADSI